MKIRMRSVLQTYKKSGFVSAGLQALTHAEVCELSSLSNQAFVAVRDSGSAGEKHPDYMPPDSGVEGVKRIPQHHPRIAQILDKVVSDSNVRKVLDNVLGPHYKIWQVNLRRSVPGDKGLYLHQDARGETSLSIVLSSNMSGAGATIFLPRSHLFNKRMKQLKIEIPPKLLRYLSFLFTPLKGEAGDIVFFFNRTWHGRACNQSNKAFDVILVSFFPAGAAFGFGSCGLWSPKFLDSLQGTRLGDLIDPNIGARLRSDGYYEILPSDKENYEKPFSLAIDDGEIPRAYGGGIKLKFTIMILRCMSFFGRPLWYLLRNLRQRSN